MPERYLSREHVASFSLQMRVIKIPSAFPRASGQTSCEAAADLTNALDREHSDLGFLIQLLVFSEDPEQTVVALALLHRRAGAAQAIGGLLQPSANVEEGAKCLACSILGLLGATGWDALTDLHLCGRNDDSELVRKAAQNAIDLITVDEVAFVRREKRSPVASRN